ACVVAHVDPRGRRVQEPGTRVVERVRREQRRKNRAEGDDHHDQRPGPSHDWLASRVRGSTTASATSEIRVPKARNIAPVPAQPVTRNTSRLISASSIRLPSPGHDVMTSTAYDPLSSVPITSPYTDPTGSNEALNASRQITRVRGTPRASVAVTNGLLTASLVACACKRSSIAASGRPRAAAGMTR